MESREPLRPTITPTISSPQPARSESGFTPSGVPAARSILIPGYMILAMAHALSVVSASPERVG